MPPLARPSALAACLLLAGLVPLPVADAQTAASHGARLAAFGDTGTGEAARRNVDGSVADGARGYLGLGDYYYDGSSSTWRSIFDPLLDDGAYLTLGNHDDRSKLSGLFPGGSTRWSVSVGGARIVGADTQQRLDVDSPQYAFVRRELCGAPEETRVLAMHKGWWLRSGARHPGSEFPGSPSAMDRLVRDCGVDLVLAGHEHNYQRLMRSGVPYLVVGTGGQSLYDVAGSPDGTVATWEGYGRALVDLSSGGVKVAFKDDRGIVRDSWPDAPSFTASFAPRRGNEWWVQVGVSASKPLAGVDARVDGGAWRALQPKSWGDWAGSVHAPDGSLVEFRARASSGETETSGRYRWPDGALAHGEASSGFDATFRNVKGNEWWVEVTVGANGPIAGVDARVGHGSWVALEKRSWDAWAKSIRAPSGSLVEFRARSTSGASDTSGAYRWPDATPTGGSTPPTDGFTATFRDPGGNDWWVEVEVLANEPLAGVDARIGSGPWFALEKKSWGAWAKSKEVPDGATVTFRARSTDGDVATSTAYRWPPP